MARDLESLEPEFRKDVVQLLEKCEHIGYPMKPFFTFRTVYDQAKLYRQSRSLAQIMRAHAMLKSNGADFLAEVLLGVGSQSGKWATNALPGISWHQHGEAMDCYWMLNGNAEWSSKKVAPPNLGDKVDVVFVTHHENGYSVYAREAQNLGLVSGYFWKSKDSVHVQKSNKSVSKLIKTGSLTWKNLDAKMKELHNH